MGDSVSTGWCWRVWPQLACAVISATMAALAAAQPIAHWPAEGNALDAIGTHHGNLHNSTTFAAGITGQAFSLNGVNDYVSIPAFGMSGDWTIEGWMNPSLCSDGIACPLLNRGTLTVGYWQTGGSQRTRFGLYIYDGGPAGISLFSSRRGFALNEWHYLAITRAGDTFSLYVDGVLENQQTVAGATTSYLASDFYLGYWPYGGICPVGCTVTNTGGRIDEVKVWDRALSASEVAAAARAGVASSGALALAVNANPVAAGEPMVLTASPPANSTGGSVTFVVNGEVWCDRVAVASGKAACTISYPAAGAYSAWAIWSGSGGNLPAASVPIAVTVGGPAVALDVCTACPHTTIQSAVDAAPAASVATIRVAQGTYSEKVTIPEGRRYLLRGGWTQDFSSRSNDPSTTVITLPVPGIVVVKAIAGQNVALNLDGFRVTGGSGDSYEIGMGVTAAANGGGVVDLTLDNCLIDNNSAGHGYGAGVGAQAHGAGSVLNLTLNRVRVVHNTITFYAGAGLYLAADNAAVLNAQLTNTLVARNTAMYGAGFYVAAAAPDGYGGLINPGTVNLSLLNGTVTANHAFQYSYYGGGYGGGMSVDGLIGTVNITAKNSIVYGNTATNPAATDFYLDHRAAGQLTIDATFSDIGTIYNEPASPATVTLGSGTISSDPLFVSPAVDNFRPQGGSPVVDTGTASGAPSGDLDGAPRPVGSGIDMGAYEIDATPDAISFAAQTAVPLESWIESASATVSGITVPVAVSTTGGEYAVSTDAGTSWSAWSAAAGSVSAGDLIKLRVLSSMSYYDVSSAAVRLGSVNASFAATTLSGSLDIDQDGSFDAATDGVLVLRYLFGLRGDALVAGAVGANAQRSDATAIVAYLDRLRLQLDVDADGSALALTDGLLVLRHVLGLRDSSLVNAATGSGATRDAAGIDAAIGRMRP
ncbi:LamG-like jellyroll fold domain-containing protein [Paracoccus sp. (in: a-proteobacteria)]|uniref:LamG-like jellyroll fold domain-containing protein n=1 Tax=Paracoccus sp. TaxID=267 RepID=UPI00321FE092